MSVYLVATLIDIASSIVEDAQHWEQPVRVAIRARDVRARRADVVHCETDATRILRD